MEQIGEQCRRPTPVCRGTLAPPAPLTGDVGRRRGPHERQAKKWIQKKSKKGMLGYPFATIAFYGPTDKIATKIVIGIHKCDDDPHCELKKIFSEHDIRRDDDVMEDIYNFIKSNNVKSVAMTDRIIGCPHEEEIDYPKGTWCPKCEFWHGRDRWTGNLEH